MKTKEKESYKEYIDSMPIYQYTNETDWSRFTIPYRKKTIEFIDNKIILTIITEVSENELCTKDIRFRISYDHVVSLKFDVTKYNDADNSKTLVFVGHAHEVGYMPYNNKTWEEQQ